MGTEVGQSLRVFQPSVGQFFEETCNCAAEDAERLTAMLPGGEKVAEVDRVSATVHRGSSLSGMLGIVDDLCTLSEQSKLRDSSSSAYSVQCFGTYSSSSSHHCIQPCSPFLSHSFSLIYITVCISQHAAPLQVQQTRSTWQKSGDSVGSDVEVEGWDWEEEEEEEELEVEVEGDVVLVASREG